MKRPPLSPLARHQTARIRGCVMVVLGAGLLSAAAGAQWTSGVMTFPSAGIVSGGGRSGNGGSTQVVAALSDPFGGSVANGVMMIRPATSLPAPISGTRLIAVDGTVNESVSSVTVNGVAAVVAGSSFHADGVLLREGVNTLTASITDLAGNPSSTAITVTLDTRPPARPTVAAPPPVTTATSYALSGTKRSGTSLWINDAQILPLGDATNWGWTVPLVEGDNFLTVITKDAAGNASAAHVVRIVLDNLPPVITSLAPAKTNLTPLTFTGTVDDSLTRVQVNGDDAASSGRTFTAPVSLVGGPNAVTVRATSPNGFVATKVVTITKGTVPTITAVQPLDATKVVAGSALTIQAAATDQEQDPISYHILLDGATLRDWAPAASYAWTPEISQRGSHILEIRAKDAFGGYAAKQARIFVIRVPVPPPSP